MRDREYARDRDNTDVWTAVAIGAILGIGATLLLRARQDDATSSLVKRLKPVALEARRAASAARREVTQRARTAGEAGEDLLSASRDAVEELRKGARDVVRATREELRDVARDSVKQARRAARSALR